ncbi:ubiquitin-conjugating enzyme/RWD-like protein [Mycena belliarum]|uniref:Ubiquitin-conjugating enzyme/RWD-like protein n=1 Tax=Mycena belliarum TaxID=1033014 RepID=A0AAD6TMJ3_9AGAR|nr:ubiquitin-conjugating enzyme/RWD-like protein [Mycena belliae]
MPGKQHASFFVYSFYLPLPFCQMRSDDFSSASNGKKRKRSNSSPGDQDCQKTSDIIRRSIALLAATPDLPTASFSPLLNTLNKAYQSALSDEERAALQRPEDWDWELSAEQIARLSEEELTIWKDLLVCRRSLAGAGIQLHPSNWTMPVVDLMEWKAHIPGPKDTPWEGGVYSLEMSFWHGAPERVPKCRFSPPLFHPNVYPSGTWGYTQLEGDIINRMALKEVTWLKPKHTDPIRVATLLRSIQKGLNEPDLYNPSQADGYTLLKDDPKAYEEKIRAQAEAWRPGPLTGLAGRPIMHNVKQES